MDTRMAILLFQVVHSSQLCKVLMLYAGLVCTLGSVVSSDPSTGDEWHEYFGRLYLVHTQNPRNFAAARLACHVLGGELAFLKNIEVNAFVTGLLPRPNSGVQYYFFGLSDEAQEGKFTWLDGEKLDISASLWDRNEPNNSGNQDCGALISESVRNVAVRHGLWDDHACSVMRGFICERPVDLPYLRQPPVLHDIGVESVEISWTIWDETVDVGDGPVIGYVVYGEFKAAHMYPSPPTNGTLTARVQGLRPGMEYQLRVSAIRNSSGEPTSGPRGPALTIISQPTADLSTEEPTSSPSYSVQASLTSSLPWILFAIAIVLNVLFVIAIILLCIKLRRIKPRERTLSPRISKDAPSTLSDYQNPAFIGGSGTDSHIYQDLHKEQRKELADSPYVNSFTAIDNEGYEIPRTLPRIDSR